MLVGIVTNFLAELFNYNNGLLENRGTPRWNNVTVIYAGKNTGKAADTSATFKNMEKLERGLTKKSYSRVTSVLIKQFDTVGSVLIRTTARHALRFPNRVGLQYVA